MFYIQQDNKIVLFDEDKQKLQDTIAFMPQYEGLEIKEVEEGFVIYDFELMTVEEKEAKETQKERERLDMLFLTGADVERGIYQAKGMDFDDIVAMVTQLQPEGLDIKALKIELKANNFYRGNPYVNAVGTLLGFTSEQLDKFFITKDYHELLPIEDLYVENEEESNTNETVLPNEQTNDTSEPVVDVQDENPTGTNTYSYDDI